MLSLSITAPLLLICADPLVTRMLRPSLLLLLPLLLISPRDTLSNKWVYIPMGLVRLVSLVIHLLTFALTAASQLASLVADERLGVANVALLTQSLAFVALVSILRGLRVWAAWFIVVGEMAVVILWATVGGDRFRVNRIEGMRYCLSVFRHVVLAEVDCLLRGLCGCTSILPLYILGVLPEIELVSPGWSGG